MLRKNVAISMQPMLRDPPRGESGVRRGCLGHLPSIMPAATALAQPHRVIRFLTLVVRPDSPFLFVLSFLFFFFFSRLLNFRSAAFTVVSTNAKGWYFALMCGPKMERRKGRRATVIPSQGLRKMESPVQRGSLGHRARP